MSEEPSKRSTAEEVLNGVAELLASRYPHTWQRLLAEHEPDDSGHCTVCVSVPHGAQVWPCTLWTVANAARALATPGRSAVPPARAFR